VRSTRHQAHAVSPCSQLLRQHNTTNPKVNQRRHVYRTRQQCRNAAPPAKIWQCCSPADPQHLGWHALQQTTRVRGLTHTAAQYNDARAGKQLQRTTLMRVRSKSLPVKPLMARATSCQLMVGSTDLLRACTCSTACTAHRQQQHTLSNRAQPTPECQSSKQFQSTNASQPCTCSVKQVAQPAGRCCADPWTSAASASLIREPESSRDNHILCCACSCTLDPSNF
jgi:hypothetical protein